MAEILDVVCVYVDEWLTKYQEFAMKTKWARTFQKEPEGNWLLAMDGLVDEIGEVAGVLKKYVRSHLGDFTTECTVPPPAVQARLQEEIGDVLWHLAELCDETGLTLGSCAVRNLRRTKERTHWDGREEDSSGGGEAPIFEGRGVRTGRATSSDRKPSVDVDCNSADTLRGDSPPSDSD